MTAVTDDPELEHKLEFLFVTYYTSFKKNCVTLHTVYPPLSGIP